MQHERMGLGTQQSFHTGCWGGTSHSGKLRAMGSACVGAGVGGLARRGWRLDAQASRAGRQSLRCSGRCRLRGPVGMEEALLPSSV